MKITLSYPQSKIWTAYQHYRFLCICAGRRGGKTTALHQLIKLASSKPNQLVWYVAPTYRMAKRLMWEDLKKGINPVFIKKKHETDLTLELSNGSTIQMFGADNPDGLVGSGINAAFVDEAALIRNLEKVVNRSLRAALSDKKGKMVLATTPRGFNYFYSLCSNCWNFPYPRDENTLASNEWWFYSFSTLEGGNVEADEIRQMAASMSTKLYNQEINASFETPANRVYPDYDFQSNILDNADLQLALFNKELNASLEVGIDFNVDPMTAIISVANNEECWVIDSIELHSSNTHELAQEIKNRYPDWRINCYPDPSGRQRKSSAPVGITDFVILQRAGFNVIAPTKAPLVKDRINITNSMICDANGRRRLLIHPRAKSLIKALNGQCYKEGTSIPDKDSGLDHATDALGYLIYSRFNLLNKENAPSYNRVY